MHCRQPDLYLDGALLVRVQAVHHGPEPVLGDVQLVLQLEDVVELVHVQAAAVAVVEALARGLDLRMLISSVPMK